MWQRCAVRGVIPPKKANSSALGSIAAAFASPAGNKRGSAALARRAASTESTPPFCAAPEHFKAGRGKCSQADFQGKPSEAFYGKVCPKMVDRQKGGSDAGFDPRQACPFGIRHAQARIATPGHSVASARGLAGAHQQRLPGAGRSGGAGLLARCSRRARPRRARRVFAACRGPARSGACGLQVTSRFCSMPGGAEILT